MARDIYELARIEPLTTTVLRKAILKGDKTRKHAFAKALVELQVTLNIVRSNAPEITSDTWVRFDEQYRELLHHPVDLLEAFRQLHVFRGHFIVRVVSAEANGDAVVNVNPLGVMVQLFGLKAHAHHKGHRFAKAAELKRLTQGVIAKLPIGKSRECLFDFFGS